ncbi:pentatricopeptide repeat-containing protein At4g21170 [Rutidosis leptorrhynchoides]|uniref:pentatricopeptide repeat-containing protein At4g21170 n=1 Tax=Rutidosis leptorrhynchoides TaxID=125765 RepID=UPI003A98E5FE
MTHLLIGAGFVNHLKPILNSLLQNHPPDQVVKFMIKSCEKDSNFNSLENGSKSLSVFDCVISWYSEKGLCFEAIEVFNLVKCLNGSELFSIRTCNALLNALVESNELKASLSFYGAMIRHGILIDQFTWRIIAKIMRKQGKVNTMIRIIDMGVRDSVIYDLVIECCSEMGMFEVALHMFDEMSKRKLNPGFNTCASILNGACRCKNDEMIKLAMKLTEEKGYISKPLTKHCTLIQKLCDIKKTYAAHMLFKTACDVEIPLENETFGCMLRALSLEALVKDAMETFDIIERKGIQLNPIFYNEFVNILCNEDPSNKVEALLIALIFKGHTPSPMAISNYIINQCKKCRWKEAEALADLALQESILLEASCCGFLVKHYCKKSQINSAISMHDQMVKKELTLDSRTYNVLLSGLLEVLRIKEAERIFDYMRNKNLLTSETFVIMINGFCRENELKKAMNLHDEMMEMGLKPCAKLYKRLISNFK